MNNLKRLNIKMFNYSTSKVANLLATESYLMARDMKAHRLI